MIGAIKGRPLCDANVNFSRDHAYRAYTLDMGGRIFSVDIVRAADDARACRHAFELVRSYPVELWDGARRVARFAPDRPLMLSGNSAC